MSKTSRDIVPENSRCISVKSAYEPNDPVGQSLSRLL